MSLRLFKHWTVRVAEFTQGRTPQSDDAFLVACGLPDDPEARRIALVVREVFAEVGSVDPRFIYADDRYPQDLEILPAWDILDHLDLILGIEKKLDMPIPERDAEKLCQLRFTVREFIAGLVPVCRGRRTAT